MLLNIQNTDSNKS